MIEIYAFFVMFTVQIVAMSVIFPARFVTYTRLKAAEYPEEALAQLYPGSDPRVETEKLLSRFRGAHWLSAIVGIALLGWMAARTPQYGVKLMIIPTAFLLLQMLPVVLIGITGLRQIVTLRSTLVERKRKAVLQPRSLFDLISPARLATELAIYVLFVAFMLYLVRVAENPVPAAAGYALIGAATASIAGSMLFVLWRLHGRKIPMESQSERMRLTGVQARHSVYGTFMSLAFMSLVLLLPRLGLQDWLPFAMSSFFVLVAVQFCIFLRLPPSEPVAHELAPHLIASEKSS